MPTIPDPHRVARVGRYPLADRPPTGSKRLLRARWTGEFRAPRAGEWYLSGAIVEAYQAPNDLTSMFHIAELIPGKVIELWVDDPSPPATPTPR
jgi:hypothetical protein